MGGRGCQLIGHHELNLPLLAVAVGQTLVLITGGIDLSVTAVVALAKVDLAVARRYAELAPQPDGHRQNDQIPATQIDTPLDNGQTAGEGP